ncbi:MAG: two-component system sensor histidine kinase BarA [Pseudohongiellaceae bacterium]
MLNLHKLFRALNQLPLLKRICFYSFCFGAGLIVIWVLVLSAIDYQAQRDTLKQCIEQMIAERIDNLSEMVWRHDNAQVTLILSSMKTVCLPAEDSHLSPILLNIELDDGNQIQIGKTLVQGHELKLNYPISYWKDDGAQAYWLGELHITQSLGGIYSKVTWKAFIQILSHISIVGLTALMFLGLSYHFFIRRIQAFMADLRNTDMSSSRRLAIEQEGTELSQLSLAILASHDELDDKYLNLQSKVRIYQKEREAAVKASELKSQFLAKMSHELRTPLNGLLGFSTLLLETKLTDEQREYTQTIQVSLESFLYVVNDILDLSRIESGDLNITSIPFSLRSVISGVSSLLKNRAESKGLAFESRIGPDVPQTLRGDPVRIRQILINLVSNVIQHTSKGHVLINLEPVKLEKSEVSLRISIEGSGSVPDFREQPGDVDFVNSTSDYAPELKNKNSVGLDVCYQIAELMNTCIHHDSVENKGSTFWLELKLPVVKQSYTKNFIDFALVGKLNVLVIDSYELSRKITLELLQEWGIKFEAVTTAKEGMRILQNNQIGEGGFNMVLCDDLLQDIAGVDACRRIREISDPLIRIVVLCSNPQLGDAEGFFLSGVNGFLSKQLRDPYLRSVMCQVYAERGGTNQERRLVTRYSVSDSENEEVKHLWQDTAPKIQVLVVEDNMVHQQLIMRFLENKRFQVDLASNGFEAVELFKRNTFSIIFMDCLMPEMDGYETTQIIREIEKSNPHKVRTPIVALTAHAIDGEAERCFQVGMDEFITKPYKLAQLEMVLERYIN